MTTTDPLRNRLIAALRPRMTVTEAELTVDQLLPEVLAYTHETTDDELRAMFTEQSELLGQIVATSQDCLELLPGAPAPAPVVEPATEPIVAPPVPAPSP